MGGFFNPPSQPAAPPPRVFTPLPAIEGFPAPPEPFRGPVQTATAVGGVAPTPGAQLIGQSAPNGAAGVPGGPEAAGGSGVSVGGQALRASVGQNAPPPPGESIHNRRTGRTGVR